MWNRKNRKCSKLKGKIIINVTLIWFEGAGKSIPLNSILEFSIISDFEMRNVIISRRFIKNLVATWRIVAIDVVTTSCAWWEFAPPPLCPPNKPWPPNILNLPTPVKKYVQTYVLYTHVFVCCMNMPVHICYRRFSIKFSKCFFFFWIINIHK